MRSIALTAPCCHSGKITDLAVAVDIMVAGQLGARLATKETARIVVFRDSLSGPLPQVALPPGVAAP